MKKFTIIIDVESSDKVYDNWTEVDILDTFGEIDGDTKLSDIWHGAKIKVKKVIVNNHEWEQ